MKIKCLDDGIQASAGQFSSQMAAVNQMFCYLRHKKLPRAVIAVCGVCVCIYGVMFNDPPLVSVIIDTDSRDSQDTRQSQ